MVTAEQYARDCTWLKGLPSLDAINAALTSLQAAIDAAKAECDRLTAIIAADPGCEYRHWPAWERYIETEQAKAAWACQQDYWEIKGHSDVATDYVQRPISGCKKYPLSKWAKREKTLLAWTKKAKKIG